LTKNNKDSSDSERSSEGQKVNKLDTNKKYIDTYTVNFVKEKLVKFSRNKSMEDGKLLKDDDDEK